ncbi:HAMP domain-containing protein [Chitinophaga lutea]|uniref:histidine kinase n=2 Tax=Chitinophaga lutea TaxID=2488634 RepID=A0A3N4PHL2_9BACT|nr:HAMP domain-containing protein [Chitinophaga lutea]
MKLRTKYILFVGILHGLALMLSYYIFRENMALFFFSEVVILLSLVVAWRLYGQLLQPLKTLMQGIEAMQDKDFSVKFRKTGSLEMDQLIDVYNRMMDELRKERTLQEQQHFFLEKLIQTSPTGIIIMDFDDQVVQVNPRAEQLLKKDRFLEQVRALRSGESGILSFSGVDAYKVQKSHFIDRGFPRHFVMIEELTGEILKAEKKVYEKVIRMMAHEVNNTIGPVNSIIASTLRAPASLDVQHTEALEVAIHRNQHLNTFMRNFAELVKLPAPSKKPTDLGRVLSSVVKLMELKAAEHEVRFVAELPQEGELMLMADELQLEQALINILKNSIEAMDGKGTIHITATQRQLVITDTGKGIPAGEAAHIFSPFYSTKPNGQGIGLTLVREVLLSHGWVFSLETAAPGDTRFTIQFP